MLPKMVEAGRGTIIFTGATASLRGGKRFATLSAPKFALRSLGQSIAREFGPQVWQALRAQCFSIGFHRCFDQVPGAIS